MSRGGDGASNEAAERGSPFPPFVRAVGIGVAWLPFLLSVVFILPLAAPIFTVMNEKGRLPGLTRALMAFGRLSEVSFGLLCLACFAVLVLLDRGVGKVTGDAQSGWGFYLYWTWYGAVLTVGLLASVLFVLAMLAPLYSEVLR
jgi:hypothetical protein